MMLFVQLPVPSGVRYHSLHDVVLRNEISEVLPVVLQSLFHFCEFEDVAHSVVHLESVLGKDSNSGDVRALCPERKMADRVRTEKERRAHDSRDETQRD